MALVPVGAQHEAGPAAAAEGAEGVEAALGAAGAHGALVHVWGAAGIGRGLEGGGTSPQPSNERGEGLGVPWGESRCPGGALTEAGAAIGAEAEPGVAAAGEGSGGVGAAVLAPAELALVLICTKNTQSHPKTNP